MLRLLQAMLMTMSFSQALYNFRWNTGIVEVPIQTHIYDLTKHVHITSCNTGGVSIDLDEIDVYVTEDLYDLRNINFNELGGYYIRLFAKHKEINDCFTYHDVMLKVVDKEKPQVKCLTDLTFDLNSEKPLLNDFIKTNFLPSDNYCSTRQIMTPNDSTNKILFESINNYEQINFKKVGKYPIKYIVRDSSNNQKEEIFYVNIVDRTKPIITKNDTNRITLKIGEMLDIKKYYKVYDESKVSHFYIDRSIFTTPGAFNIVMTAIDEYNNQSTFNDTIEVIAEKPKIIVTTKELKVSIGDNLQQVKEKVRDLISDVTNNGTSFTKNDVNISLQISNELFANYSGHFNAVLSLPNADDVIIKISKIDATSPNIKLKHDYTLPLKINLSQKNNQFNWQDYFIFEDDSTPFIDIKTDFKILGDINKKGTYEFYITATDKHNNKSYLLNYIIVDDFEKPTISSKKVNSQIIDKVIIEDQIINPFDYFEITDNNTDPKNLIVWTEPNSFNMPSNKEKVQVFAQDEAGNIYTDTYIFKVVKQTPSIILKTNKLVLNINDKNYEEKLRNNVLDLSNNKYNYLISSVIIDHNLDISIPNNISQIVSYTLKDENNAILDSVTIEVKIIDIEAPVMIIPQNDEIKIEVNSIKIFNPLKYISIFDNYSTSENIHVKILTPKSYKLDFVDTYYVTIKATDEMNNSSSHTFRLNIVDTTAPQIETREDTFNFRVFSEFNLIDEFKASDNYDKKVLRRVDIKQVNNKKPGKYTAWFIATDSMGNETKKEIIINIVDDISPVIMLRSKKIDFVIGESNYDLQNNVILVKDNYAKDLETKVNYYHNIDFNTPGMYEVIYEVSDGFNTSYELCSIFVEHASFPVLQMENNNWVLNDAITKEKILSKIKEKDNRNIKVDLLSDISEIKTSGNYSLKFLLTDELGKNYEQIINVKVDNPNKKTTIISLMIIIPIIITSSSVFTFFLLKKKNKAIQKNQFVETSN